MQLLSGSEYDQLASGAKQLRHNLYGEKVLKTTDDRVIKLFRVKRWYSLSAIYPYSVRFQRNTMRLKAIGVPTLDVEKVFYCHKIRRHGVIYPLLEGKSLEDIAEQDGIKDELFQQLAEFIAFLHQNGVYFRSLHLGNVLVLPDGSLGLIDVADMRFSRSSLRMDQRRRNFKHLLRIAEHRELFEQFGLERFFNLYADAANLSQDQAVSLNRP